MLKMESSKLAPSPRSLDDLRLFTMPIGGTDRLSFATWDTIEVPDVGVDTVELRGHYEIERADPTSPDWSEASVNITMRNLDVSGVSKLFGRIHVSVNPSMGTSGGQVRAGTVHDGFLDSPKMCEMDGFMAFDLLDLGITAFNKEAIRLQHRITHIPPVGQGGGTREGTKVPLFLVMAPESPPVAFLLQVRTHIGGWLG